MSNAADDQGHGPAPHKAPKAYLVPWAFKPWAAFTDQDKDALRAWLDPGNWPEPEKLLAYKKYLRDWPKVPCEWLEITPQT